MSPDMPPDPAARIAELEAELARMTWERDMYRDDANSYRPHPFAELPTPNLADIHELMLEPQGGETIMDIIAEYERRLRGE